MAGRIPQSFIDELTARADIVELIGSRVELKKAGREYRACCPFHNEKTPSFWVSPQKQFYHCFGCGVHGTALGFLMEYDKLSFPEAIEELAGRLGMDVPREASTEPDTSGSTQPLYDLNLKVAKYFAGVLPGDARAKEYAKKRGLTRETVEKFMIGFAPNSWSELLKRFGPTDADRKVLLECGLIIERERTDSRTLDRHYDRFRDRLMFPIRDSRGRVLAFGGRIIDQGEPKYLNSPETLLFHKGRELYGLYEVRQSRAALKRLMVVEGYMDVARLHQAGVNYAVATLGTATTPSTCGASSSWSTKWCSASTVTRRAGPPPGARSATRCPRRATAGRSASCSCRRVTTRTPWSGRKVAKPSRSGWTVPCRCRNTSPRRSANRSTSATRTGARSSRNWPGRWSPKWRPGFTATCSLTAFPSRSSCPLPD